MSSYVRLDASRHLTTVSDYCRILHATEYSTLRYTVHWLTAAGAAARRAECRQLKRILLLA